MNDFFKKALAYDGSSSDDLTDIVVSEHGVLLYRHVDDWGNEWETASCGSLQDVAFLKGIADR